MWRHFLSKLIPRLTGMQDVMPDDRRYWDAITAAAERLAGRFGFQRVDLPILEAEELFSRGVGQGSDFFVQKEMYTLTEPDGSRITLRPEFTAGFMRAYIQNGMSNWTQPVKLYTLGPSFRRERPQAGRLRQHSQFNCEIMGEDDPAADVEAMMLAMSLYRELGFRGLTFQLNSTGCPVCKPGYVAKLVDYLNQHRDKLADIDKERLSKNPLRVLDSKEKGREELLAGAPRIADHLNQRLAGQPAPIVVNLASQEYFKAVDRRVLQARVIDCVFEVRQGGAFKVVGVHAKRARGLMMRYAAQHRIASPQRLQGFDLEGYAFAPAASTPDRLVFRRSA